MANLSLYAVNAFVILDAEGNRLVAKYYGRPPLHPSVYPTTKAQKAFEKQLHAKMKRSGSEIMLLDGRLVISKVLSDVHFYLVGLVDENELLLHSALRGCVDAISALLKHQVDKRSIIDNLDMVVLALDESIDDGIVAEIDSEVIQNRVSKRSQDTMDMSVTLNEQSLLQAYQQVKERVASHLLK
ncbi:Golgi-to-ER vesicle coat component [Dimargaris cristalligena]|uniref:Coatomer subunit zeta n=1 Tax=Dimargaris cristalligena TaxID=215637 RepID=A0A4Q0A0P0_9FUNG|nr:Golgi-to-ER vesicle coat component [Dimargaris cristalligena]RKP39564.1 Longin-like domain-containing protein [Dimargaris cristalligena]|eukprot:RKP39564.1 Longin-like domain-containing protein [Dimargaris cristalligena]